jgi:signal peptidase II
MKNPWRSQWTILLSLATVGVIVFVDRVTKIFFSDLLSHGESLPVIRNVFHMTLVHNTGIAFGLFKDQGIVFIIIPLIAVFLLIFNIYSYKSHRQDFSLSYIVALSLILGGAIGNLIDRVSFGYVIDFIDFRVWPVFNVADSAITIGALIILIKCIPLSVK